MARFDSFNHKPVGENTPPRGGDSRRQQRYQEQERRQRFEQNRVRRQAEYISTKKNILQDEKLFGFSLVGIIIVNIIGLNLIFSHSDYMGWQSIIGIAFILCGAGLAEDFDGAFSVGLLFFLSIVSNVIANWVGEDDKGGFIAVLLCINMGFFLFNEWKGILSNNTIKDRMQNLDEEYSDVID